MKLPKNRKILLSVFLLLAIVFGVVFVTCLYYTDDDNPPEDQDLEFVYIPVNNEEMALSGLAEIHRGELWLIPGILNVGPAQERGAQWNLAGRVFRGLE